MSFADLNFERIVFDEFLIFVSLGQLIPLVEDVVVETVFGQLIEIGSVGSQHGYGLAHHLAVELVLSCH